VSGLSVPEAAAALGRGRWRLGRLVRWESLLAVAVLLDFAVDAWASPYFLSPWTLSDVSVSVAEKAVVALPMALLIMSGEIDISVGGVIALASVAMGSAARAHAPLAVVCACGMVTGAAAGCFNGALVTVGRVPSIVATIGTMTLFRGIAYAVLGDGVLKRYPPGFAALGQGYVVGPVSIELVVFVVLAVVAGVVLHLTSFGRRVIATGSNPQAARMSGIATGRLRFVLFVAVGAAAGLASVLLTSRLGSTRPSIAQGWELEIVTMVILGGVAIEGGVGTIAGVVLAAILMGLVTFGLGLLNVPGIVVSVVTGAMLIVVVAVPAALRRLGVGGGRQ
jgi:rhamnose transport system permease protein